MTGPRGLSRHSSRSSAETKEQSPGLYLNSVIWALAALSTLFLGLRLLSKLLRRRRLWWDDYVLTASWIALVVSIALQAVGVSRGLGEHHSYYVGRVSILALYSISSGFCSILATCWSKTSFAISLLQFSTGRVRLFVWFIIVSVNLILGSNAALQWIQCRPVRKLWTWGIEGSCLPPNFVMGYITFVTAYSGSMDIVLALLPWKIIWSATINKKEKLGALIAMSAGVIAGVMAFLKIRALYLIGKDTATTLDLFMFGTAEPATAIMAASIPFLRALIWRDQQPRPLEFIEIHNNGRQRNQLIDLEQLDDESLRRGPSKSSWPNTSQSGTAEEGSINMYHNRE